MSEGRGEEEGWRRRGGVEEEWKDKRFGEGGADIKLSHCNHRLK